MSEAVNREVAATWTAMVANAIRANDVMHRPVVLKLLLSDVNGSSAQRIVKAKE